jgi:hypothetical protein
MGWAGALVQQARGHPAELPEDLAWTVVMRYVGGYDAYLALREDARAYEEVLDVLAGEAEAERLQALESRAAQPR